MESKKFGIVLIVLILVFVGFAGGLFYFFTSSVDSLIGVNSEFDILANGSMKNETFGDVKISIPETISFRLSNDSSEFTIPKSYESDNGIYIMVYSGNMIEEDIDFLTRNYIKDNNLTEVELEGLSENAKAYKNPYDIIEIIVVNDAGNKAVFLSVPISEELAVKMANSVIFT